MKNAKPILSQVLQTAYNNAQKFVLDKILYYDVLSNEEFQKIRKRISNIEIKEIFESRRGGFDKSKDLRVKPNEISLSPDYTQEIFNHEMMHAASSVFAKDVSFARKKKYAALVEGFNSYFTSEKEGDNMYVFPEAVAKLICEKIGEREAFKYFIKGDINGLARKIKQTFKLKNRKLVFEFFESLDLLVDKRETRNKTTLLNRTQCTIGAICKCASIYGKMLANKEYLEGERDPRQVYWQVINDLSLDYSITGYYKSAEDEKGNRIKIEGDNLIRLEHLKEDLKEYFLLKEIEKAMGALAGATISSGDSAIPVQSHGLKK